jgi:glycosyltransferase involved in cell wall biosynthesis
MKLTVTLPVYNAMPYLPAAVESVLGQTYSNFEFLIIDDGSSDGSTDYLHSLRDPRIKLIVRENRGLGTTLNELFHNSRTEYVARMDSDDICERHRIEKQMAFLRDHTDVVMLGTGVSFLVGEHLVQAPQPPTNPSRIRCRLLSKRSGVIHPTIVVKRNAWSAIGGYRFAGAGEDVDFCLRLCDFGQVANISEPLYRYRLRLGSLTFNTTGERSVGYAFAIACAKARKLGMPEPDVESFRAAWLQRSVWTRAGEMIAASGQYFYRLSIIRRAERRLLVSRAYLLIAGMCLPSVALSRMTARIKAIS